MARYEKQFPVVCDKEMKQKIEEFAAENGISQSEVARLAIESYFGMDRRPAAPAKA